LGAYDAQINLGLAAIGGKDSMSGTYQDLNVPPTLISFACANGEKKISFLLNLKNAGNKVYFFNHIAQENGLPNYDALKLFMNSFSKTSKQGKSFL
jgi:phosphoribosylformylglycinamidine synthase